MTAQFIDRGMIQNFWLVHTAFTTFHAT